jgi:hypothetical protein
MREKLLVLAKACPEISQKYESLICVAGITDNGEWRRIYPIPWRTFWSTSPNNFSKKQWIEYELVNEKPSDHRPESRKIKPNTIKFLRKEDYKKIELMLSDKITTIEKLELKGAKSASLGAIKPEIIEDFFPISNKQYQKSITKGAQQDLFGESAVKIEIPEYKYKYRFRDDLDGRVHNILCEDWEVGELYRHCENYRKKGKYKDETEVHKKVKEKMLDIVKNRAYFIVGSHYRFSTYMIVGVIYPTKKDLSV